MKQFFDALFYKIKVDQGTVIEDNSEWDPDLYLFKPQSQLFGQNYKMMEHPADSFIDYNFMVDNLEEEHLRRDVFTTAIEDQDATKPEGEGVENNDDGAQKVDDSETAKLGKSNAASGKKGQ